VKFFVNGYQNVIASSSLLTGFHGRGWKVGIANQTGEQVQTQICKLDNFNSLKQMSTYKNTLLGIALLAWRHRNISGNVSGNN